MAALGESDPTYRILQEALKKAKALTHVRPVDERIASIDRAKKRIGSCREEVVRAKEVLAQAQAKLQPEEQSLVEGEACLAAFVAGVTGVEGGSSSYLANHHFCPRVGGVASMCVTVTTREFRSSKRSQTGQESVTFDPRFGPLNQPGQACQRTGSTHWHVDWRFDQPCARAEVRRAIPDQLMISWTLLQTIPWGSQCIGVHLTQHRRLRLRWSAFASEHPTMHRDVCVVEGFFNIWRVASGQSREKHNCRAPSSDRGRQ